MLSLLIVRTPFLAELGVAAGRVPVVLRGVAVGAGFTGVRYGVAAVLFFRGDTLTVGFSFLELRFASSLGGMFSLSLAELSSSSSRRRFLLIVP